MRGSATSGGGKRLSFKEKRELKNKDVTTKQVESLADRRKGRKASLLNSENEMLDTELDRLKQTAQTLGDGRRYDEEIIPEIPEDLEFEDEDSTLKQQHRQG